MTTRHVKDRSERGVALLMALFGLLLLSAIGLGMMYSANTETAINSNYRGSLRAYYAAVAGMEEARDRLRSNTGTPISSPSSTPTSTGGTLYVVNPFLDASGTTVNPRPWLATDTYFDNEYCHDFAASDTGAGLACTAAPFTGTNWYGYYTGGATTYVGTTWHANAGIPSIMPNTNTANALDVRWSRIQMKTNYSTNPLCVNGTSITCSTSTQQGTAVCWNGTTEFLAPSAGTDCNATNYLPVYLVTSMAVAPNGSRKMFQAEISRNILPPLPAALVLDGTNPSYDTAHSASFGTSGVNANSCGTSPTPNLPSIGVMNSTDDTTITGDLFRPANYPGLTAAPDVEVVTSTQLGPYATIPGLTSIVQAMSAQADYVGTSPPDLGSTSSPKITVITGSWSSGCTGSGLLIVTGNLHCNGGWAWDGTMIILGGTFLSDGGGGGHFNGNMLLATAYDAGVSPPVPYTAGNAAVPNYPLPGSPNWAWTGGGGNYMQYDSCWSTGYYNKLPYRILATRELNY